MEHRAFPAVFLLALLAMAPFCSAKEPDCSSELQKLEPCLTYAMGQSPFPEPQCCSSLSFVHVHHPVCLCMLISSTTTNNSPGINMTAAALLPSICSVDTDAARCPALMATRQSGNAGAPTVSVTATNGSDNSSTALIPSFLSILFVLASLQSFFYLL